VALYDAILFILWFYCRIFER